MKNYFKKRRFCNHELLGCRVDYCGGKYRVTGARKCPNGKMKFRLLDWNKQGELWTVQGPSFGDIAAPIYSANNEVGGCEPTSN